MNDREDKLDEALTESFPASDPPANTVESRIGEAAGKQDETVRDNREANRFELRKNGEVAFMNYERKHDALLFLHTEVPPSLRGHHLGDALAEAGLAAARTEGLRVVAVCPFVQKYLQKHPQAGG